MPEPWLVAIDLQSIFADPASPWAAPGFTAIVPTVTRLIDAYAPRVVFTRFVAPTRPAGAWVDYYRDWSFALQPPDAPAYAIVPELAGRAGEAPAERGGSEGGRPPRPRIVTATTFGKWGPELDRATDGIRDLVLVGVSTDCCVLSTALAAADAGVRVRVVGDACAGATDADHERALAAMALYAPLITVVTAEETLAA